MTVVTPEKLPKDQEKFVFGAGDYFEKNGHLYFVLDYIIDGFVVENCTTLFSHPVEKEFVHDTRWIARDKAYAGERVKSKNRKGGE